MELSGKVVMIIGAGRGIGKASAEMFANAGADIAIAARTADEINQLASELKGRGEARVLAVPTDATDADQVEALVETAVEHFGRIDTLVYTAGTGALKPFVETTVEEFDNLMSTNVKGAFLVCKAVLPVMEKQKRGHVISLPGILGRAPMAQAAAYCASKYAMTGMMKSLALEYKRVGVRFSLLHLGGVNSTFWDSITMRVQREKMLTVEAAANALFFAATQPGEGVLGELILQPESHQM